MHSLENSIATINKTLAAKDGYISWGHILIKNIFLRFENKIYEISGDNITSCTVADAKVITTDHQMSFIPTLFEDKNINYIILSEQTYASQIKKTIPPILDDQAQLLGINVRIAHHDKKSIQKALCNRFACITHDGLCISKGYNFDDTYVAAQLLEKTAKSFLLSAKIGGAKSINIVEAWLMQKFYQLKYAKEAVRNK